MKRDRQHGFTYVAVLFMIAFLGLWLAGAAQIWHMSKQRERERELLFVGGQFRQAIGAYFEATPGPAKGFPRSLDELLRDPRYLPTRRHLRTIYADPMTGKREWGLVRGPDDGIVGVHSLSDERPLKTASFGAADAAFEGKASYAEWKFVYVPALGGNGIPPPGSQPSRAGGPSAPLLPR